MRPGLRFRFRNQSVKSQVPRRAGLFAERRQQCPDILFIMFQSCYGMPVQRPADLVATGGVDAAPGFMKSETTAVPLQSAKFNERPGDALLVGDQVLAMSRSSLKVRTAVGHKLKRRSSSRQHVGRFDRARWPAPRGSSRPGSCGRTFRLRGTPWRSSATPSRHRDGG